MKRSVDQKLRLLNFDARHGKIETGAVVKSQKGLTWRWKRKRFVLPVEWKWPVFRRETSAASSMRVMIVPKNRHRMPPHLLSQPYHEVEACRRKEVSKAKSNHGAILRQPCRYCWKGTCTRSPCEYWHPPECQFLQNRNGLQSRGWMLVPASKGWWATKEKAKERLLFQQKKRKRNPMQKVLEPIERLLFTQSTLRQASIREKKGQGPSRGKIQVKILHQRSPYAKIFEDRSQEETGRQERCARSKAWNLAKKHFQAQRERPSYILLARWRVGTPSCVNKRSRRKESLW